MGIDFSGFSEKIQSKIKAALSDNKLDAAEVRDMNLSEAEKSELMKQLAGNPGLIGDGFIGKTSSDSTFVFHDKPKNGIVNLTDKTIRHYQSKYPDKDIKEGYMQDGVLYFRNSDGKLVKDDNNVYITENIFLEEKPEINFFNQDGSINVEKFQAYLNELPETDEDYTSLMKDIEEASKEHSYWSIEKFANDQKERFIKVYQAIDNRDLEQAVELMYSFLQEECQGFDENVLSKIRSGLERLTGAKWAGPALYSTLSYIAEHTDDLVGRDENGIGCAQRLTVGLDNTGQGLGDFIFSSEGLITMGAIAGGEALLAKASSTLAPYVGAAIHSYFGAEGAKLVGEGSYKVLTGQTLDDVAEGGQEIGHGLPMMGTVVRAGGAMYKGVKGINGKLTIFNPNSSQRTYEEQLKQHIETLRALLKNEQNSKSNASKTVKKADKSSLTAKQQLKLAKNHKIIKKMSLKEVINGKSFKDFESKIPSKNGEPRYNDKRLNKIINSTKNSYLKKNRDLALSLLKRMSEMQEKSHYIETGMRYRFSDVELKEILEAVTDKNIKILDIMLEAKEEKEEGEYNFM